MLQSFQRLIQRFGARLKRPWVWTGLFLLGYSLDYPRVVLSRLFLQQITPKDAYDSLINYFFYELPDLPMFEWLLIPFLVAIVYQGFATSKREELLAKRNLEDAVRQNTEFLSVLFASSEARRKLVAATKAFKNQDQTIQQVLDRILKRGKNDPEVTPAEANELIDRLNSVQGAARNPRPRPSDFDPEGDRFDSWKFATVDDKMRVYAALDRAASANAQAHEELLAMENAVGAAEDMLRDLAVTRLNEPNLENKAAAQTSEYYETIMLTAKNGRGR